MFSFSDLIHFLSGMAGVLGLFIFGIAASWFTLYTFRRQPWQLQIAAFLGYFALIAALSFSVTTASLGAFALGSGATLLFLGLRKDIPSEEADS